MDKSKEYINMCEQAEEIQKLAPSEEDDRGYGSFFWNIEIKVMMLHHFDNDEGRNIIGGYGDGRFKRVWLPRQDQLQEMLRGLKAFSFGNYYGEFRNMLEYWLGIQEEYGKQIQSFEQGWLVLVMHEKYNKMWNGKEWIKV